MLHGSGMSLRSTVLKSRPQHRRSRAARLTRGRGSPFLADKFALLRTLSPLYYLIMRFSDILTTAHAHPTLSLLLACLYMLYDKKLWLVAWGILRIACFILFDTQIYDTLLVCLRRPWRLGTVYSRNRPLIAYTMY